MTTSPPSPPRRKRGAPPGNQNARKHGLTPRQRNPIYRSDKSAAIDLLPEIAIMRQHITDLSQAASYSSSLAEKLETLRLLTLATTALTRLVRVQSLVFTNDARSSSRDSLVGQYLTELNRYLRTHDRDVLNLLVAAPPFDPSSPNGASPDYAEDDDDAADDDNYDDDDEIPPYLRHPPPTNS